MFPSGSSGSGRQVSSQDCGTNNRAPSIADAAVVAACTLTAIWQFATLPSVPEYYRDTHADALLSLGKPVSSTTHTRGASSSTATPASRRRTPATSQVDDVTNYRSCWQAATELGAR
jgi:hypothetical protein